MALIRLPERLISTHLIHPNGIYQRFDKSCLHSEGKRILFYCCIPLYCSSVTFSIHSTTLPGSFSSQMEICDMELFGAAPCQCLTPTGQITTSPGRTSWTDLPHSCVRPTPEVMIKTCPQDGYASWSEHQAQRSRCRRWNASHCWQGTKGQYAHCR